jgi:succinyl-CoA synthetase beta subunit
LKLFEYEAKDLLKEYGIRIPQGHMAHTLEEAESIARRLGKPVVLKSQVLVSGRGKAGGIQVASNADEAREIASDLIGSAIKGHRVDSLLVEEKLEIAEQLYVSVTIDRQAKTYVVLASTSGGVDIEEVARTNPGAILRHWVDPDIGFSLNDAIKLLAPFRMNNKDRSEFASVASTLYRVAIEHDAELVELNPLVRTASGELVAADARLVADDNALFRNPAFKEKSFSRGEDTPREAEARKQNLSYVDLDGDIGIIGNGAGLVMSTIDLVQLFGGRPGNFLDIGGGAQIDVIKRGLILVMSKPGVRAVLVNILGGITRCDIVAQGIIEGLNGSSIKTPVVVRLMGTNEEEGAQILHQAGISTCASMEEAVAQVLKV